MCSVGFPSLVERARCVFFCVQVDAAVFVGSLPYIVDNTRSGEELLSEAVASAGDRSVEATPMERSIIQSIVDGRVAKLEAQLA